MVLLQILSATAYISAKYYLNWCSFHIVIMKVIGVNFFETQCICREWWLANVDEFSCRLRTPIYPTV